MRSAGPCCVSLSRASGRASVARGALHRRSLCVSSSRLCEHSAYLADVAAATPPPQLPALLRVLVLQGHLVVPPSERQGLHPLVVPLSRSSDGQVLGLLRWPTAPDEEFSLPLVQASNGGVRLLARSTAEYLHRALAEEQAGAAATAAAGADAQSLPIAAALRHGRLALDDERRLPFSWSPADAAAAAAAGASPASSARSGGSSRHAPLDVYLTRACGKFPDVCERLVEGHLRSGDQASALVTSDWYCTHFRGWAHPRAHGAALLASLGRKEEARDAARSALAGAPFWSMGAELLAPSLATAGLQGRSAAWLREALADGGAQTDPALKQQQRLAKTPQAVAMERCELLMDTVAAGEAPWGAVLPELRAAFAQAGRPELARFVDHARE